MSIKDFYINRFKSFKTIEFWCDLIFYFCLFSILGHLFEIPYCLFNSYFFGIVPDDSGVWGYPFEPFMIYGIAVVFLIVFVCPAFDYFKTNCKSKVVLIIKTFFICALVSLVFELVMGLLFNQPVDGEYPLWINEGLPGNILNQAWIVNDVLLGLLATVFVAALYPFIQKGLDSIDKTSKIVGTVVVVVLFFLNLHVTYGYFHE